MRSTADVCFAQLPDPSDSPGGLSASHARNSPTSSGCNGTSSRRRCFEYAASTTTTGGSASRANERGERLASPFARSPVIPATVYRAARSGSARPRNAPPARAASINRVNSSAESGRRRWRTSTSAFTFGM